jgi:hypothetical protein
MRRAFVALIESTRRNRVGTSLKCEQIIEIRRSSWKFIPQRPIRRQFQFARRPWEEASWFIYLRVYFFAHPAFFADVRTSVGNSPALICDIYSRGVGCFIFLRQPPMLRMRWRPKNEMPGASLKQIDCKHALCACEKQFMLLRLMPELILTRTFYYLFQAHPCLPHQEDKNLNGAIISRFWKTEVSRMLLAWQQTTSLPVLYLQPIKRHV